MRLFNGTSLGVQIVDNGFLLCGEQKVEFHPSLYTTRGATFGNSLMFAQLIRGLDGVYRLHGRPVDSHQISAMEALVLVNIKVAPNGKVTYPADSFGAKLALAQRIPCKPRSLEAPELHALVVLKPGHEIELTDTYTASDPRQLAAAAKTAKRVRSGKAVATKPALHTSPFVQVERICKTRIAFDGEAVTISSTN